MRHGRAQVTVHVLRARRLPLCWLLTSCVYRWCAQVTMHVLHVLQNHFPERLGTAVCYHAPWLFSMTWKVRFCLSYFAALAIDTFPWCYCAKFVVMHRDVRRRALAAQHDLKVRCPCLHFAPFAALSRSASTSHGSLIMPRSARPQAATVRYWLSSALAPRCAPAATGAGRCRDAAGYGITMAPCAGRCRRSRPARWSS